MVEEPNPLGSIEEGFACEGPALQIEKLGLVSVTLHQDVTVLRDPRHLSQRGSELEQAQVMKASKGNRKVEVLIAERVRILGLVNE
jgi:hypothetical protein